jgi:transposase
MVKKYIVKLTQEEQDLLHQMLSSGEERARKLTRARILLKADEHWTDKAIHQALDVGTSTVERTRRRCVEEGLEAALNRRSSTRRYERLIDGKAEAYLIALACSAPPKGRKHWSMRLLADKLVALEQVEIDSVSHETVRQVLAKNEIKPWLSKQWVIPPKANAEFVYHMEDVLNLYHEPYDPRYPTVCFDETSKQLILEIKVPQPPAPGQVARYDYEYERNGVRNLFMFFEPLGGWRHVKVTERRTKVDWAHCMKQLVDEFFPDANRIRVVQDQLNTHDPAALYQVFEPQEARRLLDRLEFRYTPKHGSWLNMAEIEFSVLSRQCLDQRIPNEAALECQVTAWEEIRNTNETKVNWRFTTQDARIKLKRLYPSFHP